MISIKHGVGFIVSIAVLMLAFSFTSCSSNKGSDNSDLLLLLGLKRQATTTATRVYGQDGSFTTETANNGGISANSLYGSSDVEVDIGGYLHVVDYDNHRVLYY